MMQKLSLLENKVKTQALDMERKVSPSSTHKGHGVFKWTPFKSSQFAVKMHFSKQQEKKIAVLEEKVKLLQKSGGNWSQHCINSNSDSVYYCFWGSQCVSFSRKDERWGGGERPC